MDNDRLVTALRAAGCVFAEDEAALLIEAAGSDELRLQRLVDDRVGGRPLEHVLGWAEFFGRRLVVTDGVFVPRRRTETLARRVLSELTGRGKPLMVDLCCGCGAVAAVVADAVVDVEIHAADISAEAVVCARQNLGDRGTVHQGDLFAALPSSLAGRIDVLAANAPYVPRDAVGLMPAEARDHEPLVALDGGDDGLDVMRRIAVDAPFWLSPTGRLLIETSVEQSASAGAVFAGCGFRFELVHSDVVDGTVIVGWLPTR